MVFSLIKHKVHNKNRISMKIYSDFNVAPTRKFLKIFFERTKVELRRIEEFYRIV